MHGGAWWGLVRERPQARPQFTRAMLRRIWSYARPYMGMTIGMLALITLISVIELLPPLLARDLIDHALPNRDIPRLNLLAIGMIIIPLVSALVTTGQRWLNSRIGEGIIYDLRREMFIHMQNMSLRFFTSTKTGELMSRFTNDVLGAQNAITGTLVSVITNIITLISTLVIMLSIEWHLTLAALLVLPLFYLPTRKAGRLLGDLSRQAMELNSKMNGIMNETLNVSGALLVKIFGRQRYEGHRFADSAEAVRDIGIRRALVGRWFFMAIGLVSSIGSAVLFWLGGYLVISGAMTVGTIIAFISYLARLYQPLAGLASIQVDLIQSLVSFERVFEYLDLPIEIQDKPDAVSLDRVDGEVRIEHISFSYRALQGTAAQTEETDRKNGEIQSLNGQEAELTDAQHPISVSRHWALEDVSFIVKPGQLAALVGPSGAGKTTISYLLPRLYDPQSGAIRLDGYDVRDLSQATLARHIGLVTQETYLFHDTVRANLLYARADATQEELEQACRAAHIHDIIMTMPEQYDTVVGERGYRLSGGEKQRVALARVILKNPSVLMLDEATSSLDSESEAFIQEALDKLLVGRTSIVIAHRLSTILAANIILVLDQGKIVEQGNHETLMAQNGLYTRLYETQFRGMARGRAMAQQSQNS
ncbi:MAG: ABC transporter ATP-binding protein [Chloroflexi bacterium]|nr:ABC transporter ATP-binding protein [Chloroflexota bacterium]